MTEAVLDAVSANAAGFRAAAVLGAGLVGDGVGDRGAGLVADRLARLNSPLILAFDADEADQRGAKALQGALRAHGWECQPGLAPPCSSKLAPPAGPERNL